MKLSKEEYKEYLKIIKKCEDNNQPLPDEIMHKDIICGYYTIMWKSHYLIREVTSPAIMEACWPLVDKLTRSIVLDNITKDCLLDRNFEVLYHVYKGATLNESMKLQYHLASDDVLGAFIAFLRHDCKCDDDQIEKMTLCNSQKLQRLIEQFSEVEAAEAEEAAAEAASVAEILSLS